MTKPTFLQTVIKVSLSSFFAQLHQNPSIQKQPLEENSTYMSVALKIVVVGDGAVGKTSLLQRFVKDDPPGPYIPTVFDNVSKEYSVDDKDYSLDLWDTAGQEEFDSLRVLSYRETDCFLLCFSLLSSESLEHAEKKWKAELTEHSVGTPIIVVGNKSDLRDDESMIAELSEAGKSPVDFETGRDAAARINAFRYVEASAMTGENIDKVFTAVCHAVEHFGRAERKKKKGCVLI